MKSFKEYLEESLKPYKDTMVHEDEVEQPTWRFSKDMKPEVVVPHGYIHASKQVFDKDKFHHFWHHPFHGVIPHEHDEAMLTHNLMANPEKYANRKIAYSEKTVGQQMEKLPKKDPMKMKGMSVDDGDVYAGEHGGIAHEILTSRNGKEGYKDYHRHTDETDEQISSHIEKHGITKSKPIRAGDLKKD